MGSKNRGGDAFLATFGTAFDELDESEAASKKPLSVENQIVTDEKGRRRFHGAFTGGFSAGYFNSVGTKEGWAPATFISSRAQREKQQASRPEDFMDTEDFGEYGIAPRQIRTTKPFTEEDATSTESKDRKRTFAWESTELAAVAERLTELVRPVSDSIGVTLMRSMGWRPGKGVGATLSIAAREKAKKSTSKNYGCSLPPEREDEDIATAEELQNMAPGMEFAQDDIEFIRFEPKSDLHGLGYSGLDAGRILPVSHAKQPTLTGGKRKTKGITGQAFGVGAFEDDDEDVYAADDFNRYDYAIGGRESATADNGANEGLVFVPAANTQPSRVFFPAPKLSSDYKPRGPSAKKLDREKPNDDEKPSQSTNVLQRASALGETHSVWSLVSDKDRRRIDGIKTQIGKSKNVEDSKPAIIKREDNATRIFAEDPKKAKRYTDFVNYLKRGLCPPQPPDLTEWDWESEQAEFRKLLPPDLVEAAVDSKERQKPLAGSRIAAAFSGTFQSKFTRANYDDTDAPSTSHEDVDKVKAVQMKMFGLLTREKHEWHPDRTLCKRFNVPSPYPDSRIVGVPHLKKENKTAGLNFDLFTVSSGEKTEEKALVVEKRETLSDVKFDTHPSTSSSFPAQTSRKTDEKITHTVSQEVDAERPPMDLFKAIFAQTSSESESSDTEEANQPKLITEPVPEINAKSERISKFSEMEERIPTPSPSYNHEKAPDVEKVESESDDETSYGPALPPPATDEKSLPPTSVVSRYHKTSKRHKKKEKKKKRKHEKRLHKSKNGKRRHNSSTSDDNSVVSTDASS